MNKNKLLENSMALITLQAMNYLAPFIVLPYLTRTVGLEGFGIISYALSFCTLILIFTDYGFGIAGPDFIARNKSSVTLISQYLSSALCVKMIILAMFGFIFCLAYFFSSDFFIDKGFSDSIVLSMGLVVISQAFSFNWFFQGIEKFKLITLFSFLSKMIYLTLVLLFVKRIEDIWLVLVSLAIGNFVAIIISYKLIKKEGYYLKAASMKEALTILKLNFGYFFSRVSVSAYSTFNALILGSLSSIANVAIYSSAEKIYQVCQNLTYAVSQAFYPYLARTRNTNLLHKYVCISSIILVFSVIFVFLFNILDYVVLFLFGPDFHEAVDILKIFVVSALVNFLSVNYGYPLFSSINKTRLVNYTVYFASFIQIIMLSVLFYIDAITPVNLVSCVLISEVIVLISRVVLYNMVKND
ncbi:Membrane protein involved in the export of O-antigen, teichoic acid lipoteichoic acids [Vibrio chagasii]|nr:Membrane protein involved in the export of O-antigen, teichoic acid lipoteichoic acids [Vibrio chagasii]CAH7412264.1 Membrane protein involved in the export of O-antigen, teichoic acid lipoteichoic acids [Vibrio chagasii]CAH7429835.1 Membrane protein involved in the export of O-antigen, teichoic acid lipoteichoic acids [Vibrio chagasii]